MQGYNDSQRFRPVHSAMQRTSVPAWASFGSSPRRFTKSSSFARPTTTPGAWASAKRDLIFGSTANGNPSIYMPIPNRYYEQVRGWATPSAQRRSPTAIASNRSRTRFVKSIITADTLPRPVTRCTPHGISPGVLEPHGVRQRADRAPGRHSYCNRNGADFHLHQPLQSAGQRRRMDRADHGGSRPGWQRLGDRLVQLHRPAQPDARRFQTGKGQPMRPNCGIKRMGGSIASFTRATIHGKALPALIQAIASELVDRPRDPTMRLGECTPSGCWSNEARPTWCRV